MMSTSSMDSLHPKEQSSSQSTSPRRIRVLTPSTPVKTTVGINSTSLTDAVACTTGDIASSSQHATSTWDVSALHRDIQQTNPHRVVLIAVDTSPYAQFAFDWAVENYLKENDYCLVCNVIQFTVDYGPYGFHVDFTSYIRYAEEVENQMELQAQNVVKKFCRQLTANKIQHKGIIAKGDPREELVRLCDDFHADSIILGNRGLGAFKRMFLGSCCDYVVHHANAVAVVVKATDEQLAAYRIDQKKPNVSPSLPAGPVQA